MDERISNFGQVATLRRYTVTEGREKGLDVIDCDNGTLRFLLNVNKACDIMQLFHKGQNMTFVSKNGFTQRETPFGNRFEGGMLYTCGLDSVGDRDGFEPHGTLHNTPAQITRAECTESGIVVEAVIRDTEMGGKNLVLKRKITAAIGESSVTVEDKLVNEAYSDAEYCLLYHVNLGYPMLDEGAKVIAEATKCEPRTPWAGENMDAVYDISAPTPRMEETCHFLTLKTAEASLVNEKIGKKFTVSYSGDTLPHFVEWKNMVSGDYALGLEPCTTELDEGRFHYNPIKAGETALFSVKLTVTELK